MESSVHGYFFLSFFFKHPAVGVLKLSLIPLYLRLLHCLFPVPGHWYHVKCLCPSANIILSHPSLFNPHLSLYYLHLCHSSLPSPLLILFCCCTLNPSHSVFVSYCLAYMWWVNGSSSNSSSTCKGSSIGRYCSTVVIMVKSRNDISKRP